MPLRGANRITHMPGTGRYGISDSAQILRAIAAIPPIGTIHPRNAYLVILIYPVILIYFVILSVAKNLDRPGALEILRRNQNDVAAFGMTFVNNAG